MRRTLPTGWRARVRPGRRRPARSGRRRPSMPQAASASRVSAPAFGRGGEERLAVVREKRGAGAGWRTPSCSTNTSRATMCGCSIASVSGRTGATHASVPSKTSVHSACVRAANASVIRRRSSSSRLEVVAVGRGLDAEQLHELVVELRLQRTHRHVPAVGGLVEVVERHAAVEQVGRALLAHVAAREVPELIAFRLAVPSTIAASTTWPSPLSRASSRAASTPMTRYVEPPPKSPTRLAGKCGRALSWPMPKSAPVIAM